MDNAVQTNRDTGLLKIIAFVTMAIDHIGYVFFPQYMWLRVIGRLAFPIFAYCLALGCVYTKNPKKYALRLLAFALVSQPFYSLAFFPYDTGLLFDSVNYGTLSAAASCSTGSGSTAGPAEKLYTLDIGSPPYSSVRRVISR